MPGNENVKSKLIRSLEDWDVVSATSCLTQEENEEFIVENSMELVPILTQYITKSIEEAGPHLAKCCQDLLVIIAEKGSPKENLVAFLEQIDSFQDVVSVKRILPGLAVVLKRIKPSNMSVSWAWALSTVSCHLKTCSTPENMGFEGVERLSLDETEAALESIELVRAVTDFIDPLVEYVEHSTTDKDNRN